MSKPKKEAAPVDPWIIEKIKREEKERKRREEQPQIPLDTPEYDPDEKKRWEEEERKKKENPGGVEKIDLL